MDEYSRHHFSHILRLNMCFFKSIETENKIGTYVHGADFSPYFNQGHLKMPVRNMLIGPKPLCIRFDKIDGFIRIYDGTRYLILFGSEKYDAICNRIRHLISLNSSITYVFFHYYTKIKVDF